MEQATSRRWASAATVALALLAGFIVLLLLFPATVLHSNPPKCFSTFDQAIPCGQMNVPGFRLAEWSLLAGATAVMLAGSALTRASSPRR